jgi:hypothetical protein
MDSCAPIMTGLGIGSGDEGFSLPHDQLDMPTYAISPSGERFKDAIVVPRGWRDGSLDRSSNDVAKLATIFPRWPKR